MEIARIFEQANLTPDKPAVVHNGVSYSYAHFARWIEACRHYLAQQKLPIDSVAVICAKSLLEKWVLGLALRSLGVTTVEARNADEIRELDLRNIGSVVTTAAESPVVLEDPAVDSHWRLTRVPAEIQHIIAQCPIPKVATSGSRPGGHILRTSGTTGTYKKVLWEPTAQSLAIPSHAKMYGISIESVVYVANFGLWTGGGYRWPLFTWAMGGTVIIHQAPDVHQPLVDHELTHIMATAGILSAIIRAAGGTPRRNDATRLIVTGGTLPKAMLIAAKEHLTRQVYSLLASTEGSTLGITPIEHPDDLYWHRIHPSREVQVVDEAGTALGPGREGVVRVRPMDGLNSYLDDEAATRTFFRDGWFYPGDLGLFGDDGRLTLRGRASDVINVLGDKIATGSIEQALRDRLGAEDACIVSIPGDEGDDEVHLVIQMKGRIERADLDPVLRAEMQDILRVPVHVSFTETLPRNEMGKIRRLLLKQQLIRARAANPRTHSD